LRKKKTAMPLDGLSERRKTVNNYDGLFLERTVKRNGTIELFVYCLLLVFSSLYGWYFHT
jgi:hypothetical protein